MNQSVKLKRMQTHFEKVFDRSITMSHLGWMMMRICIIYNKDIQVKGRLLPPRTISIVEKAEPTRKKQLEVRRECKTNSLNIMNKLFISSKCSISPRRDLQIFLKFSMEAGKKYY